MYFLSDKRDCCGCSACLNICPKNCIKMKEDEEGFEYPYIDNKDKCNNCGLCEKTCPILNNKETENSPKVYACKNNNIKVRKESSSGGIFTLLSEEIIGNNGAIFGATFDNNFDVYHTRITDKEQLYKLRGSKYVQSNINDCYMQVKSILNFNKPVLFSGTPCQVAGLHSYLKRKYENLYTVEVACHGVPSPMIFKKYKKSLESKYNSKIKGFTFRSKEEGWSNYKIKATFENGKVFSQYGYENLYMKGFVRDLYIRPSCTKCRFKSFSSGSDIMLADYWGVETKFKEFNDNTGVSLVFINSEKAMKLFNDIRRNVELKETDIEHAISYNECIVRSVEKHKKSNKFYSNVNKVELNSLLEKCLKERKETKLEYYCRAIVNVTKKKLGYKID